MMKIQAFLSPSFRLSDFVQGPRRLREAKRAMGTRMKFTVLKSAGLQSAFVARQSSGDPNGCWVTVHMLAVEELFCSYLW